MKLRKFLLQFSWKLQRALVPGLRDSQYAYRDAVAANVAGSTRWLDLGCGHHCFGAWMVKEERELLGRAASVVGLDYEFDSVRQHPGIRHKLAGDVSHLPLRDRCFNLVTANMVMEHLTDPVAALQEIRRVLKDGGILIFHTPNVLHYQFRIASLVPDSIKKRLVWWLEGRQEGDVFPTFYRINSLRAIREMAAQTGYEVREVRMLNSWPETYMLGPVVALELLAIRLLNGKRFEKWRSNIITVLQKPAAGDEAASCALDEAARRV